MDYGFAECPVCSVQFEMRAENHVYCTRQCSARAYERRSRERKASARIAPIVECVMCGTPFPQSPYRETVCSDSCRKRRDNRRRHKKQIEREKAIVAIRNSQPQACDFCKCEYVRNRQTKYCSQQCMNRGSKSHACSSCGDWTWRGTSLCQSCRQKNKLATKIRVPVIRHCRLCEKPFEVGARRQFCSDDCRVRFDKRSWPSSHRRRARKYGVPYDSSVTLAKAIERFGRGCAWCGELILSVGNTTDPDGACLDHIVPMALRELSPGHVWSNVQVLHNRCNSRKLSEVDMPALVAMWKVDCA